MTISENTKLNWIAGTMALLMVPSLALNALLYTSLTSSVKSALTDKPLISSHVLAAADSAITGKPELAAGRFEQQLLKLNRLIEDNQQQLAMLVEALPPKPSLEQVEVARAKREAKKQRRRDTLMLDLGPQDRAVARHAKWLEENRDEIAALDQEMQSLKALAEENSSQ